jgi:hypothetical protein
MFKRTLPKVQPSLTLSNKEAHADAKPGKHDVRRTHRLLWRYRHGTRNATDVLLGWLDLKLSVNPKAMGNHATSNKVIFS